MRRKDGVVFASEMKSLVSAFGSELHISTLGLVASMLYYWVPDQMCSLRGVDRLPPGTWIEFRPDGTSDAGRYWDITEEAAVAQECHWDLREVIEDSVNAHLVADVPVSSFLSGGSRLEHRHRVGKAGQSADRRLHHHLPGRGPTT